MRSRPTGEGKPPERETHMIRRLFIIILFSYLFLQGCQRIHEPWAEKDRLVQERSRTPDQTMTLRNRVMRVQADR